MLESILTRLIQQKAMSQTAKTGDYSANLATFSSDYVSARRRFVALAQQLGCELTAYPIVGSGPHGESLTIDVAIYTGSEPDSALLLSSGIHGVEGFFGSALQLSVLEHWLEHPEQRPHCRVILIHSLNPYGFAWRRRANEQNVDLNRNLILPHQTFRGSPALYAALDHILNPKNAPISPDGFPAHFAPLMLQHGVAKLTDAITRGQYDYPYGLYYGGDRPSELSVILSSHLQQWLGRAQRIIHLDVHTGLGDWARYKLLFDHPVSDALYMQLQGYFGAEALEPRNMMVDSVWSGGLGHFCQNLALDREYICAVVEFGTYKGLGVLAGMRAENQSYFWLQGTDPDAQHKIERSKQQLVELFCPTSPRWRKQTLSQGLQIIEQALTALDTEP